MCIFFVAFDFEKFVTCWNDVRSHNRPFPSCLVALLQSDSWCIALHMKMSFHSHVLDKTHFHMKGFARGLALKTRHKTIRKWPIVLPVKYFKARMKVT